MQNFSKLLLSSFLAMSVFACAMPNQNDSKTKKASVEEDVEVDRAIGGVKDTKALEAKVANAEKALEEAKTKLTGAEKALADFKEANKEPLASEAKAKLAKVEGDVKAAKAKVKGKEGENEKVKKELETAKAGASKALADNVEKAKKALELAKSNLDKFKEGNKGLLAKDPVPSNIKSQLIKLESAITNAEKALKDAEDKLAVAKPAA